MQTIGIGPELPNFGSWQWIGLWMIETLKRAFEVVVFSDIYHPPDCDILVFLKFIPKDAAVLQRLKRTRLVFVPVDVYGASHEIVEDREMLRCLHLIIVHSPRLVRYFRDVAPCVFIDHPVKYCRDVSVDAPAHRKHLIWVGKSCHLPQICDLLVRFTDQHPVLLLSDFSNDQLDCRVRRALETPGIRCIEWNPQAHADVLESAVAAIDLKPDDFRSRHKPPAKCLDFLASGIPVITNAGSIVDLYLRSISFEPLLMETWKRQLDQRYYEQTRQLSIRLRSTLSPEVLGDSLLSMVQALPGVQ